MFVSELVNSSTNLSAGTFSSIGLLSRNISLISKEVQVYLQIQKYTSIQNNTLLQ